MQLDVKPWTASQSPINIKVITAVTSLTVAALALSAAPRGAHAAGDIAAYTDRIYERLAFDAADADGDGLIDEAEFVRDAAAAFTALDKDRSETLTPDELGPHDPAKFSKIDRDGDGQLTFSEVMHYKMEAFRAADRNQDGYLSFEEMYESAVKDVHGTAAAQ